MAYVSCRRRERRTSEFPMPVLSALGLSIAFDSARAAVALREQVHFSGRRREARAVETESIPALFAYFEQSMAAAVFSYQCMEAYANQSIARRIGAHGRLTTAWSGAS